MAAIFVGTSRFLIGLVTIINEINENRNNRNEMSGERRLWIKPPPVPSAGTMQCGLDAGKGGGVHSNFLREEVYIMTKKLFAFVIFTATAGIVALALLKGDPISVADAAIGETMGSGPACPNPGLYTGTSNNGNFQDALDDAIAAAETCAGCCDMLVTWQFVAADGLKGGIAGFNVVNVEIKASW